MIKIIADEHIDFQRLDSALASILEGFSRSKIQTLIKNNLIKVNNQPAKASQKIKLNDLIEINPINIDENLTKLEPQNIYFEIVYQDENMAVINKPSGILTHPTTNEEVTFVAPYPKDMDATRKQLEKIYNVNPLEM